MATPKKIHVKKNDTVVVISGKDAGKKGKVLVAMPSEGKIIVEGVAMATKHKKPRGMGQQGGIIHQEAPIFALEGYAGLPQAAASPPGSHTSCLMTATRFVCARSAARPSKSSKGGQKMCLDCTTSTRPKSPLQ